MNNNLIIKNFLILPDCSIKEAMKKLDTTAEKVLFVCDEENKLLGSLTDGDIRRWILKNGDINDKIIKCYNKNPFFVKEDFKHSEIKKLMLEKKLTSIPVVDKDKKILNIIFWENIFGEQIKTKKIDVKITAVIMAGGKGTRMDPFTRILPKPLVPFNDKAIVEVIMDKLYEYGIDDFYLTLNHKANMIKSYFDNIKVDYNLEYINETKPLGTAGSLNLLPQNKISDNIIVVNCDTLINTDYKDLLESHLNNNNDITIVTSMQNYKIPYGVIEINNNGNLDKLIEKPEYNFLTITGMYILKKTVIKEIPNKKFDMIDLIRKLKQKNYKIGVYPISEKSWIDVGQWEKYRKFVGMSC